jgi:hypothetical protein
MGTLSPHLEGPPPGGTSLYPCADIVGEGEWEPWTSSPEDADAVLCEAVGTDDDYGASPTPEPDVVLGGAGASSGEEKYDVYDGGDMDVAVLGAYRRQKERRLAMLRTLRQQVQFPLASLFDKEDINLVEKTNHCGSVKKEVLHAIIPWNRLEQFVEGESTCRDFPCTFLRKKKPVVKAGARSRITASSYT